MHRTCLNCKYFHGCLSDEEPSQYHIHNYCEKFNRTLGKDLKSEINVFLNEHWDEMCRARIGKDYFINDDFETGEACCWMFAEAAEPCWLDEEFEKNRKHNLELAIDTLEFMLKKDTAYDKFDRKWVRLDECYDEKELAYFKSLLERLKGE